MSRVGTDGAVVIFRRTEMTYVKSVHKAALALVGCERKPLRYSIVAGGAIIARHILASKRLCHFLLIL
jgi:hypothetical protein